MYYVLLVIAFIVLSGQISRLSSRVERLEKSIANKDMIPTSGVSADNQMETLPVSSETIDQVSPQVVTTFENPSISDHSQTSSSTGSSVGEKDVFAGLLNWLKQDWLLKLGGFLVLIGLGWFLTYAFIHNWIGPVGQITLGVILGILLAILGIRRIKEHSDQGGFFIVLGYSIILASILTGHHLYGFFISEMGTLLLIFLVAISISILSISYQMAALAIFGLVMALLAPVFVDLLPSLGILGLFSYLFVVVLANLLVVYLKGWRSLSAIALVGVFIYSFPYVFEADNPELIFLAYTFAIIFLLTNVILWLRFKNATSQEEGDAFDISILVLCASFVFLWTDSPIVKSYENIQEIFLLVWSLIWLLFGFVAYKLKDSITVSYLYVATALIFVGVVTYLVFSGPILTFAYTVEIIMLLLIGLLSPNRVAWVARLSWLFLLPIILATEHLNDLYRVNDLLTADFFATLFLTVVILLISFILIFVYRNKYKDETLFISSYVNTFLGSIYGGYLIWVVYHFVFSEKGMAVGLSLLTYTIIGLIAYIYGRLADFRLFYLYGGLILGFVVIRLISFDVWSLAIVERIIVFILIGALLMGTAFVSRRKTI